MSASRVTNAPFLCVSSTLCTAVPLTQLSQLFRIFYFGGSVVTSVTCNILYYIAVERLLLFFCVVVREDSSTDCSFSFPVMMGSEGTCPQDCAFVMGR